MSDKEKKDYDPTLLRAVGNILAGAGINLMGQRHYMDEGVKLQIQGAVKVVLTAKKELKKQMDDDK